MCIQILRNTRNAAGYNRFFNGARLMKGDKNVRKKKRREAMRAYFISRIFFFFFFLTRTASIPFIRYRLEGALSALFMVILMGGGGGGGMSSTNRLIFIRDNALLLLLFFGRGKFDRSIIRPAARRERFTTTFFEFILMDRCDQLSKRDFFRVVFRFLKARKIELNGSYEYLQCLQCFSLFKSK